MCFGKLANVVYWDNLYYPLSYTAVPIISASHAYTGTSCYSPAILSHIDTEKFSGWFNNNETGTMLWISVGY